MKVGAGFHWSKLRASVWEAKTGENEVDVELLAQGDGFIGQTSGDADPQKPVDVAQIDELKKGTEQSRSFKQLI